MVVHLSKGFRNGAGVHRHGACALGIVDEIGDQRSLLMPLRRINSIPVIWGVDVRGPQPRPPARASRSASRWWA